MIKVGSYFKSYRIWCVVVWKGNTHLIWIYTKDNNFHKEYISGFRCSIRSFVYIPELEERVKDPLFEIELQQFITKHDLK